MNNPEKINIIMFNMSTFYDWDHGVVNRNWNVMNQLATDPRVEKIVAVDFLPIGWRKAIGHYLKNILFEVKTAEMVYGDLTSACYRRTDKIYAYTTIDSLFSMNTVANELKRIEKILNLKNIVFWSYNPMFIEFIGKLNEKLFVFDTVDNWTEHPGYTGLMRQKRLCNNYTTIATKADLIFTVSDELREFYKQLGRLSDVTWIPNGVDYGHFNNQELINRENPLSKIDKPIIGYLGTIEERVDLDLLVKIATEHPDKELVLCGPVWPSIKNEVHEKLGKLKNVKLIGRVKFDDAPSYVSRFDVAIIPHKLNGLVKSMNPMKMYDYLAAGRPIVSTPGAGIEMFKDNIYIANDATQFARLIDQALKEDSPEKQAARRASVRPHSWQNRVSRMLELVFSKIN
ncbi:MAG: glycosyltransferase [Parcubacteria group bacterium]